MMIIKYWAKLNKIVAIRSGFTNYALVILVVFYLQQLSPPLLPPIITLQGLTDEKEFCSGWLSSFCNEESKVYSHCLKAKNDSNLKELLAGFFQFYRDFDYQNVICVSVGRPVPIQQFNSADEIPEEMQLYREKLLNEPGNEELKFNTGFKMHIQDPLQLHWNITKMVRAKTFDLFIRSCAASCNTMAETEDRFLLRSLFSTY